MTDGKVSDEMLMAYADGEIEGAERDRIAALATADPEMAARIARFARARQDVRDVFAQVLAEPPPEALVAAAMGAGSTRPRQDNSLLRRLGPPLAAALVLAAGLGGYVLGLAGSDDNAAAPVSLLAAATSAPILEALAATRSGVAVTAVSGGVDVVVEAAGTYRVAEGHCRLYDASMGGEAVRGLACTDGTRWHVPAVVATGGAGFRPAGEDALAALDAYLEGAGAGSDIGAEAEASLIANGWRQERVMP